jgi:transposase
MRPQPTPPNFTGQTLFVGLDVHKKSWRVSIHTGTMEYKTFTQPPSADTLLSYLRRNFPGASVQCAYEAGFSGFSAAHQLQARGVDCLVIHPPDIPTTEFDRRHKNDRNDARRIGKALRSVSLRSVYIPTPEAISARTLVRTREKLIRKQSRCKNQIRMALLFLGVSIPDTFPQRYWSRAFITWLEQYASADSDHAVALRLLLSELLFLREKIGECTRHIRSMAERPSFRFTADLLLSIPGIGVIGAMILVTELIDIRRFRSSDALASYVGLIPGEASSGETVRTTGVTTRRNAFLRHLLIESAWVAIHHDPALMQVYERACRDKAKSKAIVVVARRLLNRIRKVWLSGTAYHTGVRSGVPEIEPRTCPEQ